MTKWQILNSNRAKIILPMVFLVAIAALILPQPARADVMGAIVGLINYVVMAIDQFLGWLFAFLVDVLIFVAQYNNFTNEPAIATAWVLLRDIANMGFVVIIVIIGFGQMFNLSKIPKMQNISIGSFLPKLVIGVLLINFSKGIVGLLIDLSQIITLTFVAAFKDVAASNLVGGLQLSKIFSSGFLVGNGVGDQLNMFFLLMMIMIIMAIAIIIVAMITALFVTRIVAFWLLTVFSPVMFAASVYPVQRIKGYYEEWWKKFAGYLAMGPSLAFMVWLSFLILQNTSSIGVIGSKPTAMAEPTVSGQYVANAQTDNLGGNNVKNLAASASNPAQTGIPGLDFTTILGFVMGAGALVSTIFVAQMSKLAGSKEIGGAAMGALKKTGSYAAAGVGRAGAMARGATLGGASAVFKKLAGQENIYEKGRAGEKMDAQGYKLDASGNRIVTGTRTRDNMFGQLSTQAGTIAEKGFINTGKDKVKNIHDWWKAEGMFRKSGREAMELVNEGKAGFWKTIYANASSQVLEKSTAQKEADAKNKKETESAAVDVANQKKGAEAKSHLQLSKTVVSAKSSGEKAGMVIGAMNNKELWDKFSDEEKKYWWQELDKWGKSVGGKDGSKVIAGELNMSKLLNQTLLNGEQKKKLFKDIKPDKMMNMLSAKIRKAQKNVDEGEEVDINKSDIKNAYEAAGDYFEQVGEDGKALVNNKLKYDFYDKTMRREHYTDKNNNVDEDKLLEELKYLSSQDAKALYHKNFTRGSQKDREKDTEAFSLRHGDIFETTKEATRKAEEEQKIEDLNEENKAQEFVTRGQIGNEYQKQISDEDKQKYANGIINEGNYLKTQEIIKQIDSPTVLNTVINNIDMKQSGSVIDPSAIYEKALAETKVDGVQLLNIKSQLKNLEHVNIPEKLESIIDVLQLSSVNANNVDKYSIKELNNMISKIDQALTSGELERKINSADTRIDKSLLTNRTPVIKQDLSEIRAAAITQLEQALQMKANKP